MDEYRPRRSRLCRRRVCPVAAYLALDKTARGEFLMVFTMAINVLSIALLVVAILRNVGDIQRAKDKQATIDTLNEECGLQKEAATRRLKALKAAAYDLQTVGQLRFLAEDV